MHGSDKHTCRAGKEAYRYEHVQPPASVDWRPKNIIGPIKDQHVNGSACGCCWAFATIGTAECMVAMATGEVLSLSEQQVRPCACQGLVEKGRGVAAAGMVQRSAMDTGQLR